MLWTIYKILKIIATFHKRIIEMLNCHSSHKNNNNEKIIIVFSSQKKNKNEEISIVHSLQKKNNNDIKLYWLICLHKNS